MLTKDTKVGDIISNTDGSEGRVLVHMQYQFDPENYVLTIIQPLDTGEDTVELNAVLFPTFKELEDLQMSDLITVCVTAEYSYPLDKLLDALKFMIHSKYAMKNATDIIKSVMLSGNGHGTPTVH